jgi:predicted PurR-regulated permease PerM
MFRKEKKDTLDTQKLNDVINLSDKILRISYIFIIVLSVFFIIRLCQELNVISIVLVVLKTLAPLFIGLFLAWLFAPMVNKLNRKGIRRGLGTTLVYIIFLGLLVIIVSSIIPVLNDQMNDFISIIPSVIDSIKDLITDIFNKFSNIDGLDVLTMKENIFSKIELYSISLTTKLPSIAVNVVKSLASGIGIFAVGLIIGFYLSIGFDNAGELIITLFPKNMQKDVKELGYQVENSLRRFVNGAIIDAFFVFVITSIAFFIIGLKAPLLFGLFCGITNVIPYAGPYIGGIPAVIVGFSEGPITGVLTLVSIVLIQFLEGNFLQPVIMSKTTKLHPVTIIVGLLIFGHFFGIIGMVISTPLIAVVKAVIMFFKEKFEINLLDNE